MLAAGGSDNAGGSDKSDGDGWRRRWQLQQRQQNLKMELRLFLKAGIYPCKRKQCALPDKTTLQTQLKQYTR